MCAAVHLLGLASEVPALTNTGIAATERGAVCAAVHLLGLVELSSVWDSGEVEIA